MPPNHTTIAAPFPAKRTHDKGMGDLRSPGWLAQWPIIGVLMVLLGSLAFGAIAWDVQTNGPFLQTDVQVVDNIHTLALQSTPLTRDVMDAGYYVGEHVIVVIGAVLLLYFLYKRFWAEFSMVLITWAGEGVMWLVLSAYFKRPRPEFAVPVWHQMTSPGFPSGHCIGAIMCYGLLAYLLLPKLSSYFWKLIVILAAALICLYVGFSRIFVGDHYLTDVLAGYALGFAWSGLVYTSVELISRRNKRRQAV